jgi:hypothetical protein
MHIVVTILINFRQKDALMNRCTIFCLTLIATTLLQPVAAHADTAVVQKPLVGQTLDSFSQESAKIREQMQPNGVYGHISSADKSRVETRLADMEKMLQAHAGENSLTQADKVALANQQEEVNGILRHNDNNRLICESRAPVGSHVPVTKCRSYGEIADERKETQDFMRRTDVTSQPVGGH